MYTLHYIILKTYPLFLEVLQTVVCPCFLYCKDTTFIHTLQHIIP